MQEESEGDISLFDVAGYEFFVQCERVKGATALSVTVTDGTRMWRGSVDASSVPKVASTWSPSKYIEQLATSLRRQDVKGEDYFYEVSWSEATSGAAARAGRRPFA